MFTRDGGTVLFLPQRPYFPLGTLRHAVAYPNDAAAFTDADFRALRDLDGLRRHVREREIVKPAHGRAAEAAAGSLNEVVVFGGLVVDDGDPAVGIGAERVLRHSVGVTAGIRRGQSNGLNDADERTVVGGVKRACRAVGGHARVARGGIDIAGTLRTGRNAGPTRLLAHHQNCADKRKRQRTRQNKSGCRLHICPVS